MAGEKADMARKAEEEAISRRREGAKQRALGVKRRREVKAQARTAASNALLRAQVVRMQADMATMKDLMEKAATPEKSGTAGADESIERTGRSGISNSLAGKMAPRQLAQELENLQNTPVGLGISSGGGALVGLGTSSGGGAGMTKRDGVGKGDNKDENRRKMIEEKQGELMALLAAEGYETLKRQPKEDPKKGIKGLRQSGTRKVPGSDSSPFVREVLETTMPKKIRIPDLSFDGKSDPDDHINSFTTRMRLNDAEDGAWCKIFPATLAGIAQSWFNILPKGSIRNFDELTTLFSAQFTSSKRRDKKTVELMTMKQRKGESLKEYMGRFNEEVTTIPNVEQSLAIVALANSLNPGLYRDYLIKSEPKTLTEVFKEASQHILLEEYNRSAD